LKILQLPSNLFEGVVSEDSFANLTKSRELDATRNQLTLNVSPDWVPPFQLEVIGLAWHLGP